MFSKIYTTVIECFKYLNNILCSKVMVACKRACICVRDMTILFSELFGVRVSFGLPCLT